MKLTAWGNRWLIAILVCLVIIVAYAGQRFTHPGYIYFARNSAIWKFDLSNDQETLLLNRTLSQEASISPNGRWLSYSVVDESHLNGPRSVWVADTHTGHEKEISPSVPFIETHWLPDSRIMVIGYPGWHISSDNGAVVKGDVRPAIFDPVTDKTSLPSWYVTPPANGTILYAPTFDCAAERSFERQGQDILRVICMDASEPITVATPVSLGDVAWSANGKLLAFHAGEETITWNSWRLYIWQRETNTLKEMNPSSRHVSGLSWSPNGQWLAFEDSSNLCVVRLADDSLTCFENYLSAVGGPISWSPDSRKVVLVTCALGICTQVECDCSKPILATVDIPSGKIVKLTTGADIGFSPLWGK